jgi:hypothetical protein
VNYVISEKITAATLKAINNMSTILPLYNNFTSQLSDPFIPPETIITQINKIWDEEKSRRGDRLTNGQVYSLLEYQPDCLVIQPAEYRHVLARQRAPELVDLGLVIRPIAVTGVLICSDGLVLGRRGGQVTSEINMWEPAPAGGLNRPDPEACILEELREELGMESTSTTTPEVCGLVEDQSSSTVDIVFRLQSHMTSEEILTTYRTLGTNEYSELAFVPLTEVVSFLDTNHDHLLHALRPMLKLVGLL